MNIFAAMSVWNSVEFDGHPQEDGLYLAMWKESDGNLIVDLVNYDKDANCGFGSPQGWYVWSDYEGEEVTRDVVAYVPHNLDVASLEGIRTWLGQKG